MEIVTPYFNRPSLLCMSLVGCVVLTLAKLIIISFNMPIKFSLTECCVMAMCVALLWVRFFYYMYEYEKLSTISLYVHHVLYTYGFLIILCSLKQPDYGCSILTNLYNYINGHLLMYMQST